ncbi:ExbD/TolR family protein [Azospirillum sp. TSO22-1]|uniref:ExbD/TolR family protein n=1 Tax=Azospirillum sp. TSO22-1 TaxID=716789 RepID=UPI000D619CBE|nr:ExbD/TolR family protein [Azospirillum sp. TSO22-1]PWC41683.1 biopolymer transporter ExbD [Azospirillum sp. TSO22-1]
MGAAPMGSGSGGGLEDEFSYRPVAEINVTPFIDVMLVLLVIFMVAAPLMMVGVPVQLPKTAAQKVSQPRQPVVVSVDRDGRVFLRDAELAPADVGPRLSALAREDPDAVVYVRGDRLLSYGRVMEVMGQVSQAGFARVSLMAEGPAAPAAGKAP